MEGVFRSSEWKNMDWKENLRFFHPVADKDLDLLEEKCCSRRWDKGEMLVVPGQAQRELYLVEKGIQYS